MRYVLPYTSALVNRRMAAMQPKQIRATRRGARLRGNPDAGPAVPALHTPWRWALMLGCVAWLALVVAPPLLVAADSGYAALPHWLLHAVCHQIPERSFHWHGVPLAACHRCTGLYLGFALGVALWPHVRGAAAWLSAHPRWVAAFFVPLLVDVLLGNTPLSRFATGMVAAFPVALLPLLAAGELRRGADPPFTQPQPTDKRKPLQ